MKKTSKYDANLLLCLVVECVFHSYQWFCHFDDDIYVNILQLSQLLKQYDSRKPYYIGKWPVKRRRGELSVPVSETLTKNNKCVYSYKLMLYNPKSKY